MGVLIYICDGCFISYINAMYHTFTPVAHGGSNVFRIKYLEFFYEKHTVKHTYICVFLSCSLGGDPRPDFQRCVFYGEK